MKKTELAPNPPYPIRKLLESGESDVLDFKREVSSEHKIAKTMVSFANNKGGKLLIGVNDNGSISGIAPAEERFMLEKAAGFCCKPSIEVIINEWQIGKKTILEVEIPKGDRKPYYALGDDGKWWAYIRVGDQSLLASKVVLDVLKREGGDEDTLIQFSSMERELLQYLEKNGRINLNQYCKLLNISRRRATRILVNLIRVGVIRAHNTEKTEFYTLS
ncbi:MAG: RNA-binding domain-containing protein [Bacteroidia bacterium]|jgi:predicted HTH transcriptional regulator